MSHRGRPAFLDGVSDRRRWWTDRVWRWGCAGAAWGGAAGLGWVLLFGLWHGARAWRSGLLERGAGSTAELSGLGAALAGSLVVGVWAVVVAAPVGLGAAVAIEEFRPRGLVARGLRGALRRAVGVLASAPAIVVGLVGVSLWGMLQAGVPAGGVEGAGGASGRTLWGGALTLGLVMSPWAARGATGLLRGVPREARTAARALGASQWQTLRRVVLPSLWRGLPPVLLRLLAFAVAEGAALLIFVGSAPVGRAPRSAGDPFTTLPVQVYQWAGRPEPGFRELAWAGLLALGVLVLTLRGCAALMASRPGD